MFHKYKLVQVPLDVNDEKESTPSLPLAPGQTEKKLPKAKILENVNPSVKQKAQSILDQLEGQISVNPENLSVIYQGNEEGSSLPSLLNSILLPTNPGKEIPYDSSKFSHLVKSLGVPVTLFSNQAKTRLKQLKEPINLEYSKWKKLD